MSDVVIVDAVRTPIGTPQRRPVHHAPRRAARHAFNGAIIERTGDRPEPRSARSSAAASSQVGEQTFNIARTAWLAAGLPLDGGRHHRRHPVRLVPAGHQPRHGARRRAAWSTSPSPAASRSMSRVPIGSTWPKTLGLGVPIPKTYFEQYEMTLAVRGRRAHRRQVGHHPRRHRRLRPRARQQRAPRPGPRIASPARSSPSTPPTSTRTASPPAPPTTSPATKGLRETTLEKLGNAQARRRRRTASTPPAPRRRSPTAPPPC